MLKLNWTCMSHFSAASSYLSTSKLILCYMGMTEPQYFSHPIFGLCSLRREAFNSEVHTVFPPHDAFGCLLNADCTYSEFHPSIVSWTNSYTKQSNFELQHHHKCNLDFPRKSRLSVNSKALLSCNPRDIYLSSCKSNCVHWGLLSSKCAYNCSFCHA